MRGIESVSYFPSPARPRLQFVSCSFREYTAVDSHSTTMAVELQTPDKLEYNFYPVTSGSTQFKVKTPNDAHIALTTGPAESDPMYEIFIGGWGNTKSIIRKNRQKPDKVEVETPGILSGDEFRGFWIRWSAGSIACGKEGEAHPFMSWDDPEPFGIGYYGVCTGWGASGSWLLEDGSKVDTPDRLEYRFLAVCKGALEIEVKAPSNAHVALTTGPREADPMYELILGGWNNKESAIRLNRTKPDKVHLETPGLLHGGEFRRLTIQWDKGVIQAKKDGIVLIEWRDPAPFGISHYGVRTAWGATGHWKVRNSIPGSTGPQHIVAPRAAPQPGWSLPSAPSGGAATWVPARAGEVPPGAVPGGYDNEQLYVGRARHEGALIPGKVHPSHGVCYVAWGGQEHGKEEYEVLCGCEAAWVPAAQGQVPEGALPSGETEDGEPLFTGRAQHEGAMCVGKVQGSHTVCYIPYGGQEIAYPEYEVLVAK
ncbi:uncharacterized protein LOC126484593 isoform X1 [Schistocerca serialis cubense]|uniref:uncharacterized protein LOC126484593 isoform X1 n=2 Tax=Schistocerca TaxID=7008 RepID=UPI00214E5219|nr:uncharacterized protein LOC126484593 isoform X1 [Schistocerca serialis cubense]